MEIDETLREEGRRFGRYLLGENPPETLVERYRDASTALFPGPPAGPDAAILEFVRRRPWAVAPLESALGLLRPNALLRRKLLVMLAILETEPGLEGHFDALAPGPAAAVLRLAGLGLSSAIKVLGGIVLYPLAARPGAAGAGSRGGRWSGDG